jgi:aminoglycoside phosphotransferase (APT) family kinase protein
VEPLDHAYTNRTVGDGSVVVKEFIGPDAAARRDREAACLRALHGLVPVPEFLGVSGLELSTRFVAGVHGKDLLAAGHAPAVLAACGEMLRRIQQIDPLTIFEEVAPSEVVVHGDYGPNNLLLDPVGMTVAAVVDWEWAHPGGAIEDVAGVSGLSARSIPVR